jgi:hypothetical protein
MSLSKRFIGVVVFAVLSLFLVASAHAQYRASIQGVVTDPQGAVVDGATLTLTSKDTNISKTATSDSAGVFTFSGLAAGHYSLAIEKAGFNKQILGDVVVTPEQANSVNVQLQVGEVTQSVTVSGDALPTIDTETGNVAGTLTTQEIQDLPSFGRDPYQLARLAPGVFGDGATGSGGGGVQLPGSNQVSSGSTGSIFMTENQPQIVAGGTRNNGNSYQIDGVEVNSLAWGGSAVITPNEESVKEVQIQANPYSAENGRNSGAQVLVVSQTGTNNFHGSAFIKLHRPGLDAFQPWNGPFGKPIRDANRFNQFGGSVGGPVIKNHVFFFFSYEGLRNNTVGVGSGWYVTPQLMTQLQSTAPIASKYASLPGANAVVNSISQTATCASVGLPATQCVDIKDSSGNLLGLNVGSPMSGVAVGTHDPTFGQAATPFGVGGGLGTTPDVFFINTVQPSQQSATQYNGRLDYQLTQKDLVAFSVYWVPNNSTFFNGPARASDLWHSDRLNYAGFLLWDHTFAPTLLNEARFNATRWYFDELKSNPQEPFGFPQDNINGIGGIGLAGPVFGAPGPGVFYQTTYNFRDTVTKVISSHSLKLGTDIYKEQDNDATPWAGIPSYQFNDLWDFANDAPINEFANFDPRVGTPTSSYKHIRSNIYGMFVQDDYKLRPNLTVNLGLRWEYFGPLHDKQNNLSTVLLGPGANALTGLTLRTGGNLYNSSYHNFGPQIGFAWSPSRVMNHEFNNKFVLRGGFGIAYNRMQEGVTLNGRFNPPLQSSLFLTNSANCGTSGNPPCHILYATADTPHDIFGYPSNPVAVETFDPTTGLPTCAPATCATVNLTAFDRNLPTPIVYRYSLEGQYDLGHKWVATVGYQGSQSRHFTRQILNLDWLYTPNLNPAVNSVDDYTNDSNGHYHALITEIQHQFANTFSVDGQYTYSSCMDHGSQDFFADPFPFNVGPSYGHCDFDASNTFKAFGIWKPRIYYGSNSLMEKMVDGWELSGIYTYHTGFPFTPFYGVNVVYPAGSNIGGCSLIYPNSNFCNTEPAAYTGGAGSSSDNATFKKQYGNFPNLATNPNAYFTLPTLAATGTPPTPGIQRNLFRGPRYHDFDFSFGKDFGLPANRVLGENAKLTIRGNFYNLFNTLNLSPLGNQQFLGNITLDATTNTITSFTPNTSFGQAQGALGARVIEFQFRFSF